MIKLRCAFGVEVSEAARCMYQDLMGALSLDWLDVQTRF